MDGLLKALRSSGLGPVRLKAVLTPTNRGWHCGALYTALRQEAEDYRKALKKLQKNPDNIKARETKEEIEDFFRHGWFRKAYHIEPDYMIRKLKEESGWTE